MSDLLVHRFDVATLGNAKRTPQGFLRIPAYLTRVGVLEYRRADGTVVRELPRPRDEVMSLESLETLSAAPVTDLHPTAMVSPANVRELQIGHVSDHVKADGNMVAAHVTIQEAAAIAAVEAGKRRELSCGYACRIDATPGVYEGQAYDQVQRDITYNHVAIGPANWGRAGRDIALRLDAADGGADDDAADVFRLDADDALAVAATDAPEHDDAGPDEADDDESDEAADDDVAAAKREDQAYAELLAAGQELQGKLDGALLEDDPARYIRDEGELTQLRTERDALAARADGLAVQLAETQRALAGAQAQSAQTEVIAERDALAARVDGLTADIDRALEQTREVRAQAAAADTQRFDAAVYERADLLERARRVLPADRFDGQTTRQVHAAVLTHLGVEFDPNEADAYLQCRFDREVESLGRGNQHYLGEVRRALAPPRVTRADAREPRVPDWQKPLTWSKPRRGAVTP